MTTSATRQQDGRDSEPGPEKGSGGKGGDMGHDPKMYLRFGAMIVTAMFVR